MASQETPTALPSPLVPVVSDWPTHVLVLCIILPILATLAVAGRFIAKSKTRARLKLDDALIVAALVIHYGQIACGILTVTLGGTGQNSESLNEDQTITAGKVLVAVQYMWVVSLACAKCSVCVMLLSIFGRSRTFRLTMYATIFLTVAWTIMNFFTAVLSCNPVSLNWDKSMPGTCDNVEASYMVNAVLDILVDLIIAIAPMPFIWRLKQTRRVKVALTILFALTLFDMVLGILRGWAIGQGSQAGNWTALSLAWFFGVMEPGVAIVIACAMLMKPLLDLVAPRQWIGKVLSPISKSYRSWSSGYGGSKGAKSSGLSISKPISMENSTGNPFKSGAAPTVTTLQRNASDESGMTQDSYPTYPDKIFVKNEVIVNSAR